MVVLPPCKFHLFEKEKKIDCLSSFGICTNPTKDNVHDLILKAAKSELISKPLPSLNAIKQGFSKFFEGRPKMNELQNSKLL